MDRSPLRRSGGFSLAPAKKLRRPTGVSRRRKKQLGFEALEDRRLMTANNVGPMPLVDLSSAQAQLAQQNVQSYSSATPEGQAQILADELYWQSLASSGGSPSVGPSTDSIPTDPLFNQQWHLINSGQNVGGKDFQPLYGTPGQDINVAPVYNMGIDGTGVRVAVIDSGIQLNHPDLAAHIDLASGFDVIDPNGDGGPIIDLNFPDEAHGTAVAGLIGAIANNGIGGAGVAPGVTLIPIRAITVIATPTEISDALRHAILENADVTNNSYGFNLGGGGRTLFPMSDEDALALRDSVLFGRDGKGIINVFASGNDGGTRFNNGFQSIGGYDSAAYEGMINSRYVIAVTGVDEDGMYSSANGTIMDYPEAGPNVLVAAPTGSNAGNVIVNDTGLGSGIVTTDLTGPFGFNREPNPATGQETQDPFFPFDRDFLPDTDYTSRFNGTSAASPIAAGVVALMLQANPNLTWRDVQEILVRSARQNAQFEVPQNGAGQTSQNTWITNQVPLFHDPDPFNANIPIDNALRQLAPTLDPNVQGFLGANEFNDTISPDHHQAQPFSLTNGAGYTVSQGYGVYQEQIGYGHGVIDAEMAVKLAQEWNTKGQELPPELTYTTFVNHPGTGVVLNIPHAERGNDAEGNLIVPGGIGGTPGGGFIRYWDEYYAANPNFAQNFPVRGAESIAFSVPAPDTMSVESVELKLSLSGNGAAALDHLRIMLVSPTGTYSELNPYWYDTTPAYGNQFILQADAPVAGQLPLTNTHNYPTLTDTPGSAAPPGGFVWSVNTNRSWGERSDNAIVFDPITGNPVVDETGILNAQGTTGNTINLGVPGSALKQGWQIVMENWDATDDFGIAGLELAWHGSPIAANSQRVQGFVGIDDNRDDNFNFNRTITQTSQIDNDPNTWRLGEIQNNIDLTQERFDANATVTVRRTSDNSLVDQFVTGADGNFYFDLVPDDYTITVEDAQGRSALNDTTTGAQFVRHYQNEWHITKDWFKVWNRQTSIDTNGILTTEAQVDANGVPLPWLDGTGQSVDYGMKGINFLIDPGPVVAPQVQFQGTIFADTNGDGVFNGADVALPGVTVFGDINRDGVRNSGEVSAVTDANGQYTLTVPTTSSMVMNVGIVRPNGWTSTNDGPSTNDIKTDGLEAFFVRPGDPTISNVNFFIKPPANNTGTGGANQPGYLLGSVFEDVNANGVRDASEGPAAGFRVFIDANNSGVFDAGDTQAITNQFGAFAFGNVAPGTRILRVETVSPFTQTLPANNGARTNTLLGSSTISGITFGIRNTATLDFGDLPNQYHATLISDTAVSPLGGARHAKSLYWLGARVDTELNGNPSANADGDDVNGIPDDEDGIDFLTPFTPGSTATIKATASRNGGYLQAWADWNNDGDFNDAGERIITNRLLDVDPTKNFINFAVPASAVGQVYMRFRYGEFANGSNAISTPFGAALIGEVEDYLRTVPAVPAVVAGIPADFDSDSDVDGMDFLSWQRNMGMTSGATHAQGDSNADGKVDGADITAWKQAYGTTTTSANTVIETGDFDGDGDNDGVDFLAWQRGVGMNVGAFVTQGDGNADRKVDATDLGIWKSAFGQGFSASGGSAAAVTVLGGGNGPLGAPLVSDAPVATGVESTVAPLVLVDATSTDPAGDVGAAHTTSVEKHVAGLRRFVHSAVADANSLKPAADDDFLRRDRAFEDLFGTSRRQGLRADLTDELPDSLTDCDEAFAALAGHFERPRA